jgi:hypothetical protein
MGRIIRPLARLTSTPERRAYHRIDRLARAAFRLTRAKVPTGFRTITAGLRTVPSSDWSLDNTTPLYSSVKEIGVLGPLLLHLC